MQLITVNAGTAPNPPDISNFRLSKVTSNIPGKADYSLFGKAENFTTCKIVSSSELVGFDYIQLIRYLMQLPSVAQTIFFQVLQGNWNAFSDTEKYIIWQNTDEQCCFLKLYFIIYPTITIS